MDIEIQKHKFHFEVKNNALFGIYLGRQIYEKTLRRIVYELKEINLTQETFLFHTNDFKDNFCVIRDGKFALFLETPSEQ